MTDIVLSKDTIKRLAKDVKQIVRHPLTDDHIYYVHDEENILRGYALIIGPVGTPYSYGNYLFKLHYPPDYPHSPPRVTYHTNDGIIRFNPNLYRNGKVCLSMLNTWVGDQWSPCNSISSVLLTICTVFNENPFLNEPNIQSTHSEIGVYNKILAYGNFSVAMRDVLCKDNYSKEFPRLVNIAKERFVENYSKIKEEIRKHRDGDNVENDVLQMNFYRIKTKIQYSKIEKELDDLIKKIQIENK